MKQAICISGSPNANGSTAMLLQEIARGMRDAGMNVRTFRLGEMDIGYCRGCNACAATRRCARRDDMDALTAALLAADVVCIGSPSYWGDVTAQLKAVFDRSTPLCDTKPGGNIVPPGKLGISAAVRAGRLPAENLHLLDTIEHYFGHLGIKPAARLHAEGINSPGDLAQRTDFLQRAYETGLNILHKAETHQVSFSLSVASAQDVPELALMNKALILDEGSENPMTIAELETRMREFLTNGYTCVLIRPGSETAGYCLFRPEEGHNGGKPGVYLRQYYIKPGYRRQGLGRTALQSIVDTCFADAAFVSLDVLDCNTVGKAFWAGVGFKPVYHRMVMKIG